MDIKNVNLNKILARLSLIHDLSKKRYPFDSYSSSSLLEIISEGVKEIYEILENDVQLTSVDENLKVVFEDASEIRDMQKQELREVSTE